MAPLGPSSLSWFGSILRPVSHSVHLVVKGGDHQCSKVDKSKTSTQRDQYMALRTIFFFKLKSLCSHYYCLTSIKISIKFSLGNQITVSLANYERVAKEWSISLNGRRSFEKFSTTKTQIISVVEKNMDSITNYLFSVSCDSGEMKNLHLIRCESVGPSKDCFPVLYSNWYVVVVVTKFCGWICVTVGIIADKDSISWTKYGTITWAPVNCAMWNFHHALEWYQSFNVDEGKYKRIRRVAVCATGI